MSQPEGASSGVKKAKVACWVSRGCGATIGVVVVVVGLSPLGEHMQGESLPQKRGGGRIKVCWLFTDGRGGWEGRAAGDGACLHLAVPPDMKGAPAFPGLAASDGSEKAGREKQC